ncbi:uncharacterized protein LOC108864864 [Galendromus occidentalis]|uniref:Uncharacterized protein LOC108864864 n=1 Tax=Galendromus occidentalis TaxID=34638 RepID=A0AAJ7L7T4_9ACAR|nr:uncharacterized protein LOC108864864 [Galendromus occidentalis]
MPSSRMSVGMEGRRASAMDAQGTSEIRIEAKWQKKKCGLLYKQFLPLAYCFRSTGCLFIEGFHRKNDSHDLRVRSDGWYILYAMCVHLIVWGVHLVTRWRNLQTSLNEYSDRGVRVPISFYTAVAINLVVLLQVVINTGTIFARGSTIRKVMVRGEVYDRNLNVTRRDCPDKGRHWIQFTLSYGFAIPLNAIFCYVSSIRPYRSSDQALWLFLNVIDILSLMIFCMWANASRLMLKALSHIFWMYLRRINTSVQTVLRGERDGAKELEENRLFLCEFYGILSQTNDLLKYSVLVFYPCTMLVLTVLIYSCIESIHETWQIWYALSYGLYSVIDVCHSSYVVHVMQCEAVEIRSNVNRAVYSGRSPEFVAQAQLLLQALDVPAITFTGCGFFRIRMSLVVTVLGSVLTYAVILIQTSQGFQCGAQVSVP